MDIINLQFLLVTKWFFHLDFNHPWHTFHNNMLGCKIYHTMFLQMEVAHTILAKLGPLHTRDWESVTITLQALSLVEKAKAVQVRFTLVRLRDQGSIYVNARWMWSLHGFLMESNGSCFMVIWAIFKNHLLEVGLTQNWETMPLQTLTPIDLFYFNMCEDPHE